MGNIASTVQRRNTQPEEREDSNNSIDARSFLQDSNIDYADYQQTLHQYLSQRYAHRYNNRQRTYQQTAPSDRNDSIIKESRSQTSISNSEVIALVLKRQNLDEVPAEVFNQTEITSLDLSNNSK
jgi:hypothetical protein